MQGARPRRAADARRHPDIPLKERCHPRDLAEYFPEELDPFWPERIRHEAQTRNVPAPDERDRQRVPILRDRHMHHNHWDSLGGLLGSLHRRRVNGDDYLDVELQKLLHKRCKQFISSCLLAQE